MIGGTGLYAAGQDLSVSNYIYHQKLFLVYQLIKQVAALHSLGKPLRSP